MASVDTCTSVTIAKEHTRPHNATNKTNMNLDQPTKHKTAQRNHHDQHLASNKSRNIPTPIKGDRFRHHINGYDPFRSNYLLRGLTQGFHLDHEGPRFQYDSDNLKSAKSNPDLVTEKIRKEQNMGRIMGPYTDSPIKDLRISPLGLVPKKTEGSWRLIHHLSYPDKKLDSINAGISDESAAVHFAGISEAIQEIQKLSILDCAVFLAKTDIRSAFRILPVHPDDYNLLGFKWNNKFYYDRCLPMGCRSSCKIFEEFSSGLEWIAKHKLGVTAMVHILDDFLIIGKSKEDALSSLKSFVNLCEDVGVPLVAEKTELPSQTMDFVGITLDTLTQEARLPPDKLQKCRNFLNKFLKLKTCTLKELQSLIGLLNFACSVIQPGRAFLRRMINLTMKVSETQKHIHLTSEVKKDMQIWLLFLDSFNGKSLFLNETFLSSKTIQLHTDSAQSKGYAGVYNAKWFYGPFPEDWKALNIMTLEFYPIILAIAIWGPLWQNHSILFFTDNEALVYVINKQTSGDLLVMKMVRFMVLTCLQNNILFKAKHIPGKKNVYADSLSRLQVDHFLKLAPHAQRTPVLVPTQFLPQNFWNTLTF